MFSNDLIGEDQHEVFGECTYLGFSGGFLLHGVVLY